jgi:hypothetical protein
MAQVDLSRLHSQRVLFSGAFTFSCHLVVLLHSFILERPDEKVWALSMSPVALSFILYNNLFGRLLHLHWDYLLLLLLLAREDHVSNAWNCILISTH